MIKIKYKALFAVQFTHTFYTSGLCPDIEMVPTAECAGLIRSLGLHYLTSSSGGQLYAKVRTVGLLDTMQNALPEGTRLSFLLRLKNTRFENFSNLNLLKPAGNHYYFNNLVNNLAADSTPLLVSDPASKTVGDNDQLAFVSSTFAFSDTGTASKQMGKLQFVDRPEVLEQEVNNSNNVFNHNFDLQRHEPGRIKFFIGGTEKASFYSIPPGEQAGLFGLVEIFYRATLPAPYQFQNADNSVASKIYHIAFTTRQTKWRYIITRKFNPAISSVNVGKTNGSSINFSLLGGTPAGTFIATSDNPLPFSEAPITGIKLSDNTNKVIVANLPNPPLNLIKTEGAETFSDILITI
jgi:hypothetical protein